MNFDQIFLDILDWVRRLLWSRNRRSPNPYKRLKSWSAQTGYVHLIERDTPRAIATFLYCPKRFNNAQKREPKDVHLHLDSLALSGRHRHGGHQLTHRITVLEASHWLKSNGSYDAIPVYAQELQLVPKNEKAHLPTAKARQVSAELRSESFSINSWETRDRLAVLVLTALALRLLNTEPAMICWAWEVEQLAKEVMGRHYSGETPKAGGLESDSIKGVILDPPWSKPR